MLVTRRPCPEHNKGFHIRLPGGMYQCLECLKRLYSDNDREPPVPQPENPDQAERLQDAMNRIEEEAPARYNWNTR